MLIVKLINVSKRVPCLQSGKLVALVKQMSLLQWRHIEHDGVSNHRRLDCLLNHLFRRRSKKTSKIRVTGLCEGIHRWPMDSFHKGLVKRKIFPFGGVMMLWNQHPRKGIQYIPRNMHTVFALLCFVVVIRWLIFPYPSGLLHWHCGNLTIAPVPAKQTWWIWINTSCEFIMNDCVTTTKQSTTKPCAYFLGYTVTSSLSTSMSAVCHHTDFNNCIRHDCPGQEKMHWATGLSQIAQTLTITWNLPNYYFFSTGCMTDRIPSLGQALAASWGRQSRGDPAERKGLLHRLGVWVRRLSFWRRHYGFARWAAHFLGCFKSLQGSFTSRDYINP